MDPITQNLARLNYENPTTLKQKQPKQEPSKGTLNSIRQVLTLNEPFN